MKESKVDVILMRIEESLSDAFRHVPEQISRWGINNIVQATFSFLFGWTVDGRPVKIACTDSGVVKTVNVGTAISTATGATVLAGSVATIALTLPSIYNGLYVYTTLYAANVWTSTDGATFCGPFIAFPDRENYFPISVMVVKVQQSGLNAVDVTVLAVV